MRRVLALALSFLALSSFAQNITSFCWLGTNEIDTAGQFVSPYQTTVGYNPNPSAATFSVNVPRGYKVSYWAWSSGNNVSESLNALIVGAEYGVIKNGWTGKAVTESTSFDWERQAYSSCGTSPALGVRLDPIPYNIAFEKGNASATGSMETMSVGSYIAPTNLTMNAFGRTGYTYIGWATNTTTMTKVFSDGQSVTGYDFDSVVQSNDTVTLYACWTPNVYTVTFGPNGGSVAPSTKQATYDAPYGELPTPTWDGHSFKGWYTAKTGGTKVEPTTKVETASDHTLYAQWDIESYTVTCTYEGTGTGSISGAGTYPYGTQVTLTATAGTDSEFVQWTDGVMTQARTETVTSNVTYSAVFDKESTYTIIFDGNGGTCNLDSIENVKYAENVKLTKAVPSKVYRAGYAFLGWSENASATEIDYENGETVSRLTKDASITLYAVWSPISYSIAFAGGAGSTGSMDPIEGVPYDVVTNLTPNAFQKTGCSFLHWQLGERTFADGAAVSNLTTTANETVTLTAVWDAPYWVRFEPNGGEGEMAVQRFDRDVPQALTSNAFTRTGCTFAGWKTNGTDEVVYTDGQTVTNIAEDGETNALYAVWSGNEYTVKYAAGCSQFTGTTPDQDFVYGQAQPLRDCGFVRNELWTFTGWSNTVSGTFIAAEKIASTPVSNLTATAGGIVTMQAIWSSNLSDLSRALDCDNLIWESRAGQATEWVVTSELPYQGMKMHKGNTCAKQENGDYNGILLDTAVKTNGTLTFWWLPTNSDARLSVLFKPAGGNQSYLVNMVEGGIGEWQQMSVVVPVFSTGSATLSIGNFQGDGPGTLYIDDLTWTPEGGAGYPVPEAKDARNVSALSMTAEGLSLSFDGDENFAYHLLATDSLSPMNWYDFGPTNVGAGTSQTFVVPIDTAVPQRFFKIETLQRTK